MNIGSIFAYLKSYTNTPTLPADLVECNGQTLNDPTSPYHNQVIPNLNGTTEATKRFLRGSTTSGTTGGATSVSHSHSWSRTAVVINAAYGLIGVLNGANSSSTSVNITPSYYEVVYVIKIK